MKNDDKQQKPLVNSSLPLQTKLEMFYDFLYERGVAKQLGVGIDIIVKHFIDERLLSTEKQCDIHVDTGSYYWVKLMSDDKYEPAIAINLLGVMNFQFFNGVVVPCDKVNNYSECNYR